MLIPPPQSWLQPGIWMPVKIIYRNSRPVYGWARSARLAPRHAGFSPGFAAGGTLRPASEDRSGQTATRSKLATHHTPLRAYSCNDIMENLVHGVFIEDPEIAIGEEVHLESLELDAVFVRQVLNGDGAVVWHAGFRANGTVLRKTRGDDVAPILVGPGVELRQFCFDASAGVIGCVVGHDGSHCTLLVDFQATASCRKRALPLSSCGEGPPESFDALPCVSSHALPEIEAAVRFRLFVQRCGCRSVALPFL